MKAQTHSVEQLLKENQALREAYDLLKQKEHYFRVINLFTTSLMVQDTVEDIVWDVAKNAIARLGYVDCVIYLVDPKGEYLIQRAAHGPKNPIELDIKNPIKIKVGEGIVGTVAQTGLPEIIYDTRLDDRYIVDDESRLSEIAVPIINSKNQVIGVIDSEHPKAKFYSETDLEILTTISSITATKLGQAYIQEQLRRSNRDLEEFAYIASHDLQEPLRMVGSYAQLLDRKYRDKLDEKGIKFLDYMLAGAKRMNHLVNDLLAYAQVDNRDQKLELVDCNTVIKKVLDNLNVAIMDSGAVIELDKLPKIKAHFSQIMQLFQNLLSNALKFRSEKRPEIKIRVKKEYSRYVFSVADNGIGISDDFHQKIFKVFKRLNSRSQYEGTGIGLSICKKIVENLEGQIWVQSNEEGGSTFYFSIPD